MEKTKSWWQSRTVWAGLVAMIVGTLKVFGVGHATGEEEAIVDTIMQIIVVVASMIAIQGRVSATKQIKKPGLPDIESQPGFPPLIIVGLLLLACLVALPAGGCQGGLRGVQLDLPFYTLVESQAISAAIQAENCWDWYRAVPEGLKPQIKPYCRSLAGMSDVLFILLDESDGIDPNSN